MSNRTFTTDFGCAVSHGGFTHVSGGGYRFKTPSYSFVALAAAREVHDLVLQSDPSATIVAIEKFSVDQVLSVSGPVLLQVCTTRDNMGAVLLNPLEISSPSRCSKTGDTCFLVAGRHSVQVPELNFSEFLRAVDYNRLKNMPRDSRPAHFKGGTYSNALTCDWRGAPPRPRIAPQACEWRGFEYD